MGVMSGLSGTQVAACETVHVRKDGPDNRFRYNVNYLLLPMLDVKGASSTRLFSWNRRNVVAFHDADHGNADGAARDWALGWAARFGLARETISELWLLTQPRMFGYVFNPVSFWFFLDDERALRAVLVEVNNTFGDRHSYFCMHDEFAPIERGHRIQARKVFHVSPFQDVVGDYTFRFDVAQPHFGVWIDYTRPDEGGLFTSLTGTCVPMTTRTLLGILLRKPFGAARVTALIHWQALKLAIKKAGYRARPPVPDEEVTR